MEIDAILEGQEVSPIITDNHPLYINAYKKLLYNPIVRSQSELLPIVLDLIQQRLQLERELDPTLKAILRGQPVPPQQGGSSPQDMGQTLAPEPPVAAPVATPAQPSSPIGV